MAASWHQEVEEPVAEEKTRKGTGWVWWGSAWVKVVGGVEEEDGGLYWEGLGRAFSGGPSDSGPPHPG